MNLNFMLTALLFFALAGRMDAARYYVNASLPNAGDGLSWATGFTTLQSALLTAEDGDEIWVASGTYTPGNQRIGTFLINKSLSVFGGFAGDETLLNQRNLAANPTIVSGEIGTPDLEDNTYNLFSIDTDGEVTIDGFIIERGFADGGVGPQRERGAAVKATQADGFTLRNCLIRNNTSENLGGGVFISNNLTSFVLIESCIFEENSTTFGGAIALYTNTATAYTMNRCTFHKNFSRYEGGAIVMNYFPSSASTVGGSNALQIVNSSFSENDAIDYTASMYLNGPAKIGFCSFFNNWSNGGYNIEALSNNQVEVVNSVFDNDDPWSNTVTATSCLVSENTTLYGSYSDIIYGDPLFVHSPSGDLRLHPDSPARNAANAALATPGFPTDLAGFPRAALGAPDMGCYEVQNLNKPIVYVKKGNSLYRSGTSWNTAHAELSDVNMAMTSKVRFWLSAGEYSAITDAQPSPNGFDLCDECEIIGGFTGVEQNQGQANPLNATILTGQKLSVTSNLAPGVVQPSTQDANYRLRNLIIENSAPTDETVAAVFVPLGATMLIENCLFRNNRSTALAEGGGAIVCGPFSTVNIADCVFTGNGASAFASVVFGIFGSETTMTRCIITANNPAGFNQAPLFVFNSAALSMSECTISNNTVTGDLTPSLLFASAGVTDIQRTVIKNNTITGNLGNALGNGVILSGSAEVTLTNSLLHNNNAEHLISGSETAHRIVNCTLADNVLTNSTLNLLHIDHDPLVTPDPPESRVYNCIVFNPDAPDELESSGGAFFYSPFDNFFRGNTPYSQSELPWFISPETDDYRLQHWSPAIGNGNASEAGDSGTLDLDGQPRTFEGMVDLGCYQRILGCRPPNTSCSNALELPFNEDTFVSTACADDLTDFACNLSDGAQVWYTFTAPQSGSVEIVLTHDSPLSSIGWNLQFAVYSGNCDGLTPMACVNNHPAETSESLSLENLVPNAEYAIQVISALNEAGVGRLRIEANDACLGDLNGDGIISAEDLLIFLSLFGQACPDGCLADFDSDLLVSASDLLVFLTVFGTSCE